MRRTTCIQFLLLLVVMGAAQAQPQGDFCEVRYELLELGSLGTLGRSSAWALNNRGHVIGNSASVDAGSTAFLWSCARGIEDIGVSTGLPDTAGVALNERDQVIIYASGQYPEITPTAMLWDRRFGAAALPQSFLPHTITNAGVLADGLRWWTAATGLRDFDVDAPIVDSRLTNFGRLGGTTTDADEFSLRFFTWTRRDGFKDLGAWPDEFVVTSDINDRGDLLFNSGTLGTAVVLDRDGNTHTLPREPNVIDVVAVALNLQREVIGFKLITQGNPPLRSSRSVVWDAKRGYRDLDALLYGITTGHSQFIPTAINEWGWIAGSTHDSAALALPVPAGNRRYENLRRLQGPKLCRALDEIRVHRVLCSLRD